MNPISFKGIAIIAVVALAVMFLVNKVDFLKKIVAG